MRPYPIIPEHAKDDDLLRLSLEYICHRVSCAQSPSNFQKNAPCKCGKDALVELIKKRTITHKHQWSRRRDGRQCDGCGKVEFGAFE